MKTGTEAHSGAERVQGGVGHKCYQNTLMKFSNNKKEVALEEEKSHSKRRESLLRFAGCEWMQEQLL